MGCCGGGCGCKAGQKSGAFAQVLSFCSSVWALSLGGLSLIASFFIVGHACEQDATQVQWYDPAFVAVVLCGLPLLAAAMKSLFKDHQIRSTLLISIAMIACLAIGQIFAAGEVAFIMALGEKLEDWTLERAKRGLHKLVTLVPKTARKVVTCPKCLAKGMKYQDIPVKNVKVGDGLVIRNGETIPVDGVVTAGETTVDQSTMTGESEPINKTVGDEVYSGTLNRLGEITIRATKIGEDSTLQKLVKLVAEAETRSAPMQRIADKWAAILVPVSLSIAILTFLGCWAVLGDVTTALVRGVTILVVFCPCALALATPTSVMAAIGQATKYGVIIKSGEALEKMGSVSLALFDKTGTLQEGDHLRNGAKETIDELRESGVKSLMISGDHEPIARRFAAEAGIDDFKFECLPEDKSRIVTEYQAAGKRVMMVGDGVNDALALKLADVGIAMGGMGTDIAQEYADVSLVTDDLTKIPYLRRLSVACVKLIKTNIAISMAINFFAILSSILGWLGPVSGALVHNVGSVLVVLNAALLYDRNFCAGGRVER